MTAWTLVELCAGSAALTYWLLGARGYQIVPYQGSKWRLRKQLTAHLAAAGFEGPPAVVELSDPSFWGAAHTDILTPWRRARVLAHLRRLEKLDPREVYDSLHKHKASKGRHKATAEFLFLQRLAWSGRAVGTSGGEWGAQGFSTSSAYGRAATGKFREVKPQLAHLIRVLGRLELAPAAHRVRRSTARPPDRFRWRRTAVYIDPPYRGTTGYPDGDMGRERVVELALSWHAAGAHVLVSEAEAVVELERLGWASAQLVTPKGRMQTKKKPREEWLTFSR